MLQLIGNITVSRRLAQHKVWLREPLCAGAAWLDLLLLANTDPADIFLHGEPVHIERGQLAWAIHSLAERWRRSREWVTKFLKDLVEDGQLILDSNRRRTIITICNYDAFNIPADSTTDPTTEPATVPTTERQQNQQPHQHRIGIGEGIREKEGGSGAPPRPDSRSNAEGRISNAELPGDSEVSAYCAAWPGDMSRGIPAGIPEVWWLGWLAQKLSAGPDRFPRDWRRVLVLAFQADWIAGHPKARAGLTFPDTGRPDGVLQKKNGADGMSPAQARLVWGRELAEVEGEMESRHGLDQPLPEALVARAAELRAKLAGLDTNSTN